MSRPFAVIAGGGTGGHVQPALAVARALVDTGHDPVSIHFVGSRRGLESTLVPAAGFRLTRLPGRGIPRRLGLTAVQAVIGLAAAVVQAVWIMGRERPRVVLAVGGYASLPCGLAAALWRVPLVVEEQNAVPGRVNRLVGRFGRAAAVAFPGTPLPGAVVTGTPVRPEVESVSRDPAARAEARRRLGLPGDRTVLGVAGGSLGARRINEAVLGLAEMWKDRTDLAIHHVVGSRDWAELGTTPFPADAGLFYQRVEYEQDMPALLSAADLMVCRAGGSTVAELASVGMPAVLVPLPNAPGDHQTANARAMVDVGGAVLLEDGRCRADDLAALVGPLLDESAGLESMGRAAGATARPGAGRRVAELLESVARP